MRLLAALVALVVATGAAAFQPLGEIGIAELSKRVGLHVSTTHRILSTLIGRDDTARASQARWH